MIHCSSSTAPLCAGLQRVSSARDLTGHLLEDAPEDGVPQASLPQQGLAMPEAQSMQQSPTLGLVFPKLAGMHAVHALQANRRRQHVGRSTEASNSAVHQNKR